ncbi:MAG: DegT/DnrJ/EryC1/StrS family aminotransferase [Dehalococcoidia bacterium]|nr:MAG: DegT/DnrJ/EryC1/StrS family aminotransferase [Dehalococcoidia bacterium]
MNIQFVDLQAQYNTIKKEIDATISGVLSKGIYIMGPEVQSFEQEFSAYIKVDHAVGVASGTDALHLALLACDIKAGDEVITTPFTAPATTEVIKHCGAIPKFVDIDLKTYNLDPSKIEKKISRKTKAIIPVHLYGQACDMDAILKIARKYKLKVIEDCAQAVGTEYKGEKVGSLGHVGCFSFFPANNLGAYGDGGMVVAKDEKIAEKVRILRLHGSPEPYRYTLDGFNSRLDALQAAILRVKLKYINEWISLRNEKAILYDQLLTKVDGISVPQKREGNRHSYNYYTICASNNKQWRDKLLDHLKQQGIHAVVFYPSSLHLQEPYSHLKHKKDDLFVSEWVQDRVISLPIYPEITEKQIQQVVDGIHNYSHRQGV